MQRESFIILALALTARAGSAQTYRCSSGATIYYSDRPCPASAPSPQIGHYGPVPQRPHPSTYSPSLAKSPEHAKYLGPECAALNDAIRTAPARGIKGSTLSELWDEYRRKCGEDDLNARQQLSQARSREQDQLRAMRAEEANRKARAQAREAQCAEMREIIGSRRKREETLAAHDVRALRSLETSYNSRCLAP